MDVETADKIHVTVTDILNSSDSDSLTEKQIRHLASLKLNLDLSDLPHKFFIRQIIESFLRSSDHPQNDTVLPPNLPSTSINEPLKETPLPHSESINLFPDQWSLLRKGIPAVDEAIIEAESKIRSELESKQGFDKLDTSAYRNKQNGGEHFGQSGAESTKKDGAYHRTRLMAAREHTQDTSTVASTPLRLVPIEVIRFDGKNYQQWADRMELYLNQLKVAYVLSEPCPSGLGVADKNIAQTLSAAERWMDDDHICRQNILNSLCDNLLRHYSEKSGTAKDLWEELKLLKAEEESRQKGHKGNTLVPRADFPVLQPHKKFGPQKIPMKKPGVPHASPEADGVKKFKFCNICKKRGHYMEQCWFRKTEGMDNANVKDSVTSTNVVVGSNGADKDGAVGDSTN
uniref:DEK-C domain-containing protein n=1 Tax=Chenopodium quinoa TaxID=63459 RepID=A0A803KZP4_CHEQI